MKQHKSPLPSVAVIGMGFAGSWQEIYLLNNAKQDMTIYEIEAQEHRRFGGIAYGEADKGHQVNLPPERQFGKHDDNQDYIKWLNTADRSKWPEEFRDKIGDRIIEPGSGEFPRGLFKFYTDDRLREAKENAEARGVHIKTMPVPGEAVSVDESTKRPIVHLKNGDTVETDIWVAATGHGPANIPPFMKELQSSERVLIDPWDKETAERMAARPKDESILYIGTGMTTYDLMIRDEAQGHTGKQVMISRHADVHHVYEHGQVFKPGDVPIPEAFSLATNKDELLNGKPGEYKGALEIYQELTAPAAEGGKGFSSEQVMTAWEKKIPMLLERLPDADLRALFRQKTQTNTRRIGVAPKVGEAIDRAVARGMETWAGDIHRMEEKPDGIYVTLTRTDNTGYIPMSDGSADKPPKEETIRFDRVYSGLGMSNDFNAIQETDPFWKNVIAENHFTKPHRFGGVQVENGGKLPGSKAGYAVGMPTTGSRVEKGWTPTIAGAVVSIRNDLQPNAERILSQLQELSVGRDHTEQAGDRSSASKIVR